LAIVSSSRGFQQHCAFCSQQQFWERTWRHRSAEHFVSELEMLRDRFDVRVAMLSDETPTVDAQRWQRILDLLIERQVGTELLLETRVVDILRDEAILEKYARAGVSHIYVGVEATDQEKLDLFEKETKVAESRRCIQLINQHDIVSETSFVLGTPDETPEKIAATVALARDYGPDLAFFLAIAPWPYAGMWQDLEPHVKTRDYRRYNLVEAVVEPERMTLAEVNKALGHASRDFYMHRLGTMDRLTEHKREFLLKVMKIMMNHSYLSAHMKQAGEGMPEHVRRMLARYDAI
jgi:anaerobic magnesium-protoporphyrin IX monomethyl ester cyclase